MAEEGCPVTRDLFLPGLLKTGALSDGVFAIRDGMVNLFVVKGPSGLVCVDAGWRCSVVLNGFSALGLEIGQVAAVFLTHSHWDHARAAGAFPSAQIYLGEGEPAVGREAQTVRDGQVVTVAGLEVRVVATPGHTLGSVSYVIGERLLFVGDALRLRRGKAVSNWLGRNRELMGRSIRQLAALEGLECLLTAHTGATRDVRGAFDGPTS